MTVIQAAAVQPSPVIHIRQLTGEKVVTKISELGHQRVQPATFPKTIVSYDPYLTSIHEAFEMGPEHLRLINEAVTVPSLAANAVTQGAREAASVTVSIDVNDRYEGTLFNTELLSFDADATLVQTRHTVTPRSNPAYVRPSSLVAMAPDPPLVCTGQQVDAMPDALAAKVVSK